MHNSWHGRSSSGSKRHFDWVFAVNSVVYLSYIFEVKSLGTNILHTWCFKMFEDLKSVAIMRLVKQNSWSNMQCNPRINHGCTAGMWFMHVWFHNNVIKQSTVHKFSVLLWQNHSQAHRHMTIYLYMGVLTYPHR